MKIIYMGTPDFAVPCLERLVSDDDFQVVCVVTQPDKPKGRKQELTPSDVKIAALKAGLTVYQPASLKNDEACEYLKSFNADYIVVAAYGKILPKSILDLPKYACVNVHGSLLPKYRGAAPIQRSVLAGDKITGVTTMLMAEGLDTGDILLTREYSIGENETSGQVFDALAQLSPDLLIETLHKYANGEIIPKKQNDEAASYASMITKSEAVIDWNRDMAEIHNLVRGISPWPVAYTEYKGKKLKIYSTEKTDEKTSLAPGTLKADKNEMLVSCGDGLLLKITSLGLEGSKRMDAKSFLLGHPADKDFILG
ncbi:MAG: methionyl-tRNA formyltransferase [Clostridiales bacterium]|nr:methionyl-tRNA formyltransferase [Clostridiales bacterium]